MTTDTQLYYATPACAADGTPIFAARDGERVFEITTFDGSLVAFVGKAQAMRIYGPNLIFMLA